MLPSTTDEKSPGRQCCPKNIINIYFCLLIQTLFIAAICCSDLFRYHVLTLWNKDTISSTNNIDKRMYSTNTISKPHEDDIDWIQLTKTFEGSSKPFGNIFTNYTSYSNRMQKYIDASNELYPQTWQQLNDQLFCPIKYSKSLSLAVNDYSTSQETILKDIFERQFFNNNKQECYNPNRKFLIYDLKGISGLMTTIHASWMKYAYRAFWSNRTFILTGTDPWATDVRYCKNPKDSGTYKCYFLPVSICNVEDIVNDTYTPESYYRGKLPSHCKIADYNKSISS